MQVYRLLHQTIAAVKHDQPVYERKIIGYFSTPERAQETLKRYRMLPGFCDHPDDFVITPLSVDSVTEESHWST